VPPLHLFAPSTTQLGTRLIQCLLALMLATLSLGASAVGLVLQELPAGSLGQQAQVLIEAPGAPLSLPEALAKRAQFQPGTTVNLSFGIGAPPVWIRLEINNSDPTARDMHLVTGAPWTDRIEVHLVQDGRTLSSFQTGDELPGARGLIPAVGYAVLLQFPRARASCCCALCAWTPWLCRLSC
jgi:hypothetical protein